MQESEQEIDSQHKEPFVELHRILDALKRHDLGPALQWATENCDALNAQGSTLEFKLHRLAFLDLLKKGPKYQNESIQYARENVSKFVSRHEKGEIVERILFDEIDCIFCFPIVYW